MAVAKLTFDDGCRRTNDHRVLRALAAYDVVAAVVVADVVVNDGDVEATTAVVSDFDVVVVVVVAHVAHAALMIDDVAVAVAVVVGFEAPHV